MKKFNALLSLSLVMLLFLPAFAQVGTSVQLPEATLMERSNIQVTNQKIRSNYHEFNKDASSRANTSFEIDYDSLNNNDRAFFWTLSKNITGNGNLSYAIVAFDSLADLAGTGYDYDAHTVTIDSITTLVSHVNASGQEDTVIMSIIELDPVTSYWTGNVLWSDSIFASTSLTTGLGSFATWTAFPEFAMCDGRFGVRIDFFGPATDTLAIIASYREDTCANTACTSGGPGGARFSNFWPSSYYGYNSGGNVLEVPHPTNGIIYRDCSGDMMFTPGGCEVWFIQDFWLWPSVSIQDTPPAALSVTSSSTPDNGTNNGTATVSVTGGIGEYEIVWGTIPPQTGPTATGLAAGTYNVIVTYGQGCDNSLQMVTVGSNVSIDDLDAGISSLKAFPNPTNGQFNLTFEMEKADDVVVKVYDLTGQLIYSEASNSVRDFNSQINLGDAANGVYLLRVETSLGATTRRIVKQ
jgi:hypothetical protein